MFGTKVDDKDLLPILGDGMIGHPGIQSGRLVPVLIVDCTRHPALETLIHAHKDTAPGDVVSTWGWNRFSKKNVYLNLQFKQPVETAVTIAFQVSSQGILVESIIVARAVYLQPVSSGSRVSEGLDSPKIVVEVPASASFDVWESVYRKDLQSKYRARGLSRTEAKAAVEEHLTLTRAFQFRRRSQFEPKGNA
jgi:hypothetical protein